MSGASVPAATPASSKAQSAAASIEHEVENTAPAPQRKPVAVPETGDKSVQTFGQPATGPEFQAVARTVQAFNWALAERDAAAVCALAAPGMRDMLRKFAERVAKKSSSSCENVLAGVLPSQPPRRAQSLKHVRVTDARIKGDHGFVIYQVPGEAQSAVPVQLEEGSWKVASLGGVPLA